MALFKISKGNSADLGVKNGTDKTIEGYAYFTPDDGKFYIDIAFSNTVSLGTNRIVLNALEADIQQSFTVELTEQSSFWSVTIPGLTELFDGLIIHISVPIKPNEVYNVLNVNGLGNKVVYYKFNEPLGDKIIAPTELTLIYRTTISSFDYIATERNQEINYGRSGWIVNSSYSINQADIYYGNLAGNAATATKLLYTPNNKAQFLRGDNIWTNRILGDIYADNFHGNLNGNAITADSFKEEKVIQLTGDTTGNASSVGGWIINTLTNYLSGTTNTNIRMLDEGKIQYTYSIEFLNYLFPIIDTEDNNKNKNSILTLNLGEGNYYSQLGFSNNDLLYYRHFINKTLNNQVQWKNILMINVNNYTNATKGYLLMSNGANLDPSWTDTIGTETKYLKNGYISNIYGSKLQFKNIIGYRVDAFDNYILDNNGDYIPYYGIATIQTNYPTDEEINDNVNYTYNFPNCSGTFVIGNNTYTNGYILKAQDPGQQAIWTNELGNTQQYFNKCYVNSIYTTNQLQFKNLNYVIGQDENENILNSDVIENPNITISVTECESSFICKIPNINYTSYFVLSYGTGSDGQILRKNIDNQIRWENLTLNGNINNTLNFYAPTSVGTANYILKSNGVDEEEHPLPPTWVQGGIKLNGATTYAFTAAFYAPTSVGSANQILKSNGLDEEENPLAPTWTTAGIKLNGATGYSFTASFYAPTTVGSANQILISRGVDEQENPLAPVWTTSGIKLNGAENYALTASFYAPTTGGTAGQVLCSNGAGASPYWSTIVITQNGSTNLQPNFYAPTTVGSPGQILMSRGLDEGEHPLAPTWSNTTAITSLGTIVTGLWQASTIGVGYGGTGKNSWTQYGVIYASGSTTLAQVTNNTSQTRKFLRMVGDGTAAGTPTWDTVSKTDVGLSNVENTALSTWIGTNKITTLGTITTGTWNGTTIGVANGGTGATSFTANSIIMSGNGTTSAFTTRAITNNTSNTTIASGTNIPTMNTLYYGLALINNTTQSRGISIYAPTSSGTSGYFLKASGGTAAPTWTNNLGEITFQKLTTSSASDSYGLFTSSNNYGSIGTSSKCWYNLYIARIMFRGGTDYTLSYSNSKLTYSGDFSANKVYNAIWNDYAEYRQTETIKYGHVYQENNNGIMTETNERLIPGCSIASDTFGSAMGETDIAKTPMAVAGRVLVYTYQPRKNYQAGMAVCSAPNGTIDIMTREEIMMYPDCIIGYVSEVPNYEEWGKEHIKVNNRIWIKI